MFHFCKCQKSASKAKPLKTMGYNERTYSISLSLLSLLSLFFSLSIWIAAFARDRMCAYFSLPRNIIDRKCQMIENILVLSGNVPCLKTFSQHSPNCECEECACVRLSFRVATFIPLTFVILSLSLSSLYS